jgi:hypothetical protein
LYHRIGVFTGKQGHPERLFLARKSSMSKLHFWIDQIDTIHMLTTAQAGNPLGGHPDDEGELGQIIEDLGRLGQVLFPGFFNGTIKSHDPVDMIDLPGGKGTLFPGGQFAPDPFFEPGRTELLRL